MGVLCDSITVWRLAFITAGIWVKLPFSDTGEIDMSEFMFDSALVDTPLKRSMLRNVGNKVATTGRFAGRLAGSANLAALPAMGAAIVGEGSLAAGNAVQRRNLAIRTPEEREAMAKRNDVMGISRSASDAWRGAGEYRDKRYDMMPSHGPSALPQPNKESADSAGYYYKYGNDADNNEAAFRKAEQYVPETDKTNYGEDKNTGYVMAGHNAAMVDANGNVSHIGNKLGTGSVSFIPMNDERAEQLDRLRRNGVQIGANGEIDDSTTALGAAKFGIRQKLGFVPTDFEDNQDKYATAMLGQVPGALTDSTARRGQDMELARHKYEADQRLALGKMPTPLDPSIIARNNAETEKLRRETEVMPNREQMEREKSQALAEAKRIEVLKSIYASYKDDPDKLAQALEMFHQGEAGNMPRVREAREASFGNDWFGLGNPAIEKGIDYVPKPTPPPEAIAMLRKNPALRPQFEAKWPGYLQ